jgi:hypothetical protein
MTQPLSSVRVPEGAGIVRDCPRPEHLRNERFHDQFDWDTVFYDTYRVGRDIVFQGPPLRNFLGLLKQSSYFGQAFTGIWPRAKLVNRNNASEIWVRGAGDNVVIDGPLAQEPITVQSNHSDSFAGRRVLHTLSKDNDIRWIIDWITFYVAVHKADAVLFYDNASTAYTADELQAKLREAFPDITIIVVNWPFTYGPQGGLAGAVNGIEAPWDSDYCQTGSLQHARLRYLQSARSVLNVDIDELVLSSRGRSIFEATEGSWSGFTKFAGAWISTASATDVAAADCRHGDFILRDRTVTEECPPKWCIRPHPRDNHRYSWSVHNLFGARKNRRLSDEFLYRHVKGISNNWKYSRWDAVPYAPERFVEDNALAVALEQAGLRAK